MKNAGKVQSIVNIRLFEIQVTFAISHVPHYIINYTHSTEFKKTKKYDDKNHM